MEADIVKFLCANQGAVDTDYLVFNLGCSVSDIISNQERFACCLPFGQPKVVVRTNLRLCRVKGCEGSCEGLHLCISFLFNGCCPFNQSRKGCCFSHELRSDHNERILKEHELNILSRTELRTLLLQSDDRLLPPICYDYNGHGMVGYCLDGYGCERLHVCETYLNRDCKCSLSHDFNDPQPLRVLQGVPQDLISSLKSIYANIQALKYHDQGSRRNKGTRPLRSNKVTHSYRGNSCGPQQLDQTRSTSDILAAIDLHCDDESNEGSSEQQPLKAISDQVYNDRRTKQPKNPSKPSTVTKRRGHNRVKRKSSGTSSYQPSTVSYQASTSSYQPSTALYQSSTSSCQPSTALYQPSTSSYQPSTSSYQPSTVSYQASTSSYQPSTALYQSSTSSCQPSTALYQPSTSSYQPSTSSYQPSTVSYQASTSSYQPSTALYQSSTSSCQPSTALYQPSTSSCQPSTSSYQPSAFSYQASTSSYQPSMASYQPSTSSCEPSTSLYQPSTTWYQASTSSYQPSTASYQPSTSSCKLSTYQNPPAQSAKRTNSICVIA